MRQEGFYCVIKKGSSTSVFYKLSAKMLNRLLFAAVLLGLALQHSVGKLTKSTNSSSDLLNGIPSKVETANKIAKQFLRRSGDDLNSSSVDVYHVAYIIDGSGSIGNNSFQRGLQALRMMIDRADRTDYAAVKFSTNAHLLFHFVSGCQARLNLMSVPYTAGATNSQAALRLARTQLFLNPNSGMNRRGGRAALVMTDGKSNINKSQTIPQANLLKAAGVEVFVLAVGSYDPAGIQEMRDICSFPYQDHLFRVDDFRSLVEVMNLIPLNSKPLQCIYLRGDRPLK